MRPKVHKWPTAVPSCVQKVPFAHSLPSLLSFFLPVLHITYLKNHIELSCSRRKYGRHGRKILSLESVVIGQEQDLGRNITSLLREGFSSDETPYQEGNDSHLIYGVKIL